MGIGYILELLFKNGVLVPVEVPVEVLALGVVLDVVRALDKVSDVVSTVDVGLDMVCTVCRKDNFLRNMTLGRSMVLRMVLSQ